MLHSASGGCIIHQNPLNLAINTSIDDKMTYTREVLLVAMRPKVVIPQSDDGGRSFTS